MKYIDTLFFIRSLLLLVLALASYAEWRRDRAINELLQTQTRTIELLEKNQCSGKIAIKASFGELPK